MLSDYNMPDMNGMELTKKVRRMYSAQELAIIGISASGTASLSAQFIKYGANDFLSKPFLPEELFFRVMQNMRMIDMVEELNNAATTDYLTKLHNRHYFYETAEQMLAHHQRGHMDLTVAMLDLDHFKSINDIYGHGAGDLILKEVSKILRDNVRKTDLVARIGGEEFAIICANMGQGHTKPFFDKLRADIEDLNISYKGQVISVTTSIGVTKDMSGEMSDIMMRADEMLYKAKDEGRNRVAYIPPVIKQDNEKIALRK